MRHVANIAETNTATAQTSDNIVSQNDPRQRKLSQAAKKAAAEKLAKENAMAGPEIIAREGAEKDATAKRGEWPGQV